MIAKNELDKIAKQIGDAELKTTGEIVCVLAKQSDDYKYIPVLWAALVSLCVPLIFMLINLFGDEPVSWGADTQISTEMIYIVQLAVFLAAFLIVQWRAVKFLLIPKKVKIQRAKRLAIEMFMGQEINLTDERTGVLLFISFGEHYAEVIADHGIYAKLEATVWQEIIDQLIVNIKADKVSDGIMLAVEQIGELLQVHFPVDGNAKNELPNHLIVID